MLPFSLSAPLRSPAPPVAPLLSRGGPVPSGRVRRGTGGGAGPAGASTSLLLSGMGRLSSVVRPGGGTGLRGTLVFRSLLLGPVLSPPLTTGGTCVTVVRALLPPLGLLGLGGGGRAGVVRIGRLFLNSLLLLHRLAHPAQLPVHLFVGRQLGLVQLQDGEADVFDVLQGALEHLPPAGGLGEGDAQHARCQEDAGGGYGLRGVADEHRGAETVVHVVPRALHEHLVLVHLQELQVDHDYLVRVLHVHAEAELLQDAALHLDDLVLDEEVLLPHVVQRLVRLVGLLLVDEVEHVDDVPQLAVALLYLAREVETSHGHVLRVVEHEGLGEVVPLEEHLRISHGHLRQLEEYSGVLQVLTAHDP